MLRAVLDSSVLVSIFLTPRGASVESLLAAKRGAFALCISDAIIAETVRTLRGKSDTFRQRYGYTDEEIDPYVALLRAVAELVTNLPKLSGAVPDDPKDDPIIANAVAAGADYLVTGDRVHLLPIGAY